MAKGPLNNQRHSQRRDARTKSSRKQATAKARAAQKEARAGRAVVKQARADLKAHRGKRELKIYRQALKDRRDKTALQKWRCVHDKRTTLLMKARKLRIARMDELNQRMNALIKEAERREEEVRVMREAEEASVRMREAAARNALRQTRAREDEAAARDPPRRSARLMEQPVYDSSSDEHEHYDSHEEVEWIRVKGGRYQPRARVPRPPTTDLHYIGKRAPCEYGCGALLWPGEGNVCCAKGKHILGPDLNPPISDAYLRLITLKHVSYNSSLLNSALALAATCTSPSRAMGGMGMHTAMGGTVSLLGKVYVNLHDPSAGPSGFDAFRVPDRFLFSCAETDYGKDYAEQLILFRDHLFAHHSAVRELKPLPVEDLEGPRLDLTSLLRVSARSAPTGRMELATVSSGVPGPSSNTVVYFDLSRHARGLPPTPIPIKIGNALFEQLQFPLLFEEGIGGYFTSKASDEERVRSSTGAPLTMHDYTKAMLFQNQRFRYLGRLGQEWLLAQHSREVEERMMFQKYVMQEKLVVQRKYNRGAAVQDEGGGSRVQMAASTPGSKAYNQALIEDSAAVTSAYGQGSVFITMTCNPNWSEITEALEPGQSYNDRPDLMARVFKLKLQQLLRDLKEGTFFKDRHGKPWKCKYIMHVIEFQKRGKPHAHIYARLEGPEEDMPRSAEDVDRLMCARMPKVVHCKERDYDCPCLEHRARKAVQQHMIHGCAKGACLPTEGPRVCKRHFPKPPCETTTNDDGGYAIYARDEGDEMVVSYNMGLLLKYDCHINVELASTQWVIKYMHKYMHKGPDSIRLAFAAIREALDAKGINTNDEVEMFQTMRYTSAGEAFFRGADFDLSRTTVGCTRLTTHLPGLDWVGMDSGDTDSKLVIYFSRPAVPEMDNLLYVEYFSRYSLEPATSAQVAAAAGAAAQPFKPPRGNAYYIDTARKNNKVTMRNKGCLHVARIYSVPVTKGEAYYLRLLVTRVAARSFEELLTHGGTVHTTYREAAEARGLLSVETEYMDALGALAKDHRHVPPSQLRHSFVMMVLYGGEAVPVMELYQRFNYFMALDLDAMGRVRAVGQDLNPGREDVYHRPAVCAFDPEEPTPSMQDYVVHEYHLLRMLSDLITSNSTRTLEEVGLPTLEAFAQRKCGGAVPVLQLHLEQYLHVGDDAEEPVGDTLEHITLIRSEYVNKYAYLLTGAALGGLVDVVQQHRRAVDPVAAFFANVDMDHQKDLHRKMYATLNEEQVKFVDVALQGLEHQAARMRALREGTVVPDTPQPNCNNLHLQARGGRGKSYVNICIIAKALSMGLMVSVSAFSGVAAILLPHGQTCHRTYGLMLEVNEPQPSMLTTRCAQGGVLAHTALHILDECDALHKNLFIAASDVATRCVNEKWGQDSTEPFGGAMVILSGDKHQCLPVITGGLNNDDMTIFSLLRSSAQFTPFATTVLNLPQRNKGDPDYDKWLEALSNNTAPGPVPLEEGAKPPTARKAFVPPQCFSTTSLDAALAWLHGPPPPPEGPFPDLNALHAVLCNTNARVDEINNKVLDTYVAGDAFTVEATHDRCSDVAGNGDGLARVFATDEYMRQHNEAGVPPASLRLKRGAVLMLIRNMLSSLGLVNGTRLRLLSDPGDERLNLLHVQTVVAPGLGLEAKEFWIPRITFDMKTPGGHPFQRRQFPVRLAYACTTNKSQGQTLRKAVFDARKASFSHGTTYTACSRSSCFGDLGFLLEEPPDGEAPTFVNVVLQRALESGVLRVAARAGQLREDAGETSDGSRSTGGSSTSSEEEEGRPAAPRARAPKDAQKKATRQKGSLGLQQRREALAAEARRVA